MEKAPGVPGPSLFEFLRDGLALDNAQWLGASNFQTQPGTVDHVNDI